MLSVLRMALPAQHDLGHAVRSRVAATLHGCTEEDRHAVELVTAELFANAVDAGSEEVIVEVGDGHACVVIRVSNKGAPIRPYIPAVGMSGQRGRGLQIVRSIGLTRLLHDEGVTMVEVEVPLQGGRAVAPESLGD